MIKSASRIFLLGLVSAMLCACVTPAMRTPPPVINHAPVAEAPMPPPPEPMMVMPRPTYKVGDAYQVGSTWYYPKEQPDYNETGIASYYGMDFHGMLTANGEVFDRNGVTAAHATLPMPVNVRVTNLENGRSLVVRVNDRGPFVSGRIIDLSEHAADLLGFRQAGTARVRVTFLGRADLYGPGLAPPSQETPPEIAMAVPAAPITEVEKSELAPVTGARVVGPAVLRANLPMQIQKIEIAPLEAVADGRVTSVPVPPATAIYVQAGAFTNVINASTVAARLQSTGARVSTGQKDGKPIYRVRIGPFQQVEDADAALARVQALGHNDVQIVVDSVTS
jgi:rare lipoprotein A